MPKITHAVALGVLLLFVAVAIPAAIDTGTSDSELVTELNRSETETVTQSLRVTLQNATDTDAAVTLRDTETLESATRTIPVDATENYSIGNETVSVRVISASNADKTARLSIHYPRTYGWAEGTERITSNLPLIFAGLALIIVVGMVAAGVRR